MAEGAVEVVAKVVAEAAEEIVLTDHVIYMSSLRGHIEGYVLIYLSGHIGNRTVK